MRREKDERITELSQTLELARAELARLQPSLREEEEGGLVNGVVGDGGGDGESHRRGDSGPAVLPITETQLSYSAVNGPLVSAEMCI